MKRDSTGAVQRRSTVNELSGTNGVAVALGATADVPSLDFASLPTATSIAGTDSFVIYRPTLSAHRRIGISQLIGQQPVCAFTVVPEAGTITNWSKNADAKWVLVSLVGAGGGGGAGQKLIPSAATTSQGGGGGGGGGTTIYILPASIVPSTAYIRVGRGGQGGLPSSRYRAQPAGTDGEEASFGPFSDTTMTNIVNTSLQGVVRGTTGGSSLVAGAGLSGSNAAGGSGANTGRYTGSNGGTGASATPAVGGSSPFSGSGGGGGSGISVSTNANNPNNGAAGGNSQGSGTETSIPGGTAPGGDGTNAPQLPGAKYGASGGGGGGSAIVATDGGDGGRGGYPGGGGGGGASIWSTGISGAGGDGGDGAAMIVTFVGS